MSADTQFKKLEEDYCLLEKRNNELTSLMKDKINKINTLSIKINSMKKSIEDHRSNVLKSVMDGKKNNYNSCDENLWKILGRRSNIQKLVDILIEERVNT